MSNPGTRREEYKTLIWVPFFALAMALSYNLFIFPNNFAPSGVGGIATMVQYVFKFNAGYLNLLINIPILIVAWKLVDREFVVKTGLFTLCFSGFLMLFEHVDFSRFYYLTQNGTSKILGPVAAAVVNGTFYGFALRIHGSSGGTDVVSFCIRRYHPEYNVTWISFVLNAVIACVSYFVYGYQFEPVICCIVYCFVLSSMGNRVVSGTKTALKFEIVTEQPEALAKDLMQELHHGVTLLPAEGAYTHEQKSLVICIVNKHQIADIQKIIGRYPGTFAYITSISETLGNFRKIK
ncbi:MAG: YitT family protein [Oscillospiraceae bacterium]|nr:YitT family protein [Oscillospiraceae bacterium]